MKTYSRHKVAEILNISPEAVFGLMVGRYINPDTGKPIDPAVKKPSDLLRPSIIIKNPVLMQRSKSSGERLPGYVDDGFGSGLKYNVVKEELRGVFGIDGFLLIWDENGKADVRFGGQNRACLYQDEYVFMVTGPLTIGKDELFVTRDDLKHYQGLTGDQSELPCDEFEPEQMEPQIEPEQKVLPFLPLMPSTIESEQAESQGEFDAAKHIERRVLEGKTPDEIAVELVEKYGTKKEKHYGLIARKLYDHPASISNGTWRKRGARDYARAKINLTAKHATPPRPTATQ